MGTSDRILLLGPSSLFPVIELPDPGALGSDGTRPNFVRLPSKDLLERYQSGVQPRTPILLHQIIPISMSVEACNSTKYRFSEF